MKAVVAGQQATYLAQETALLGALAALILIVSLAGCIVVPVRTPTVIKNPAGKKGTLPVEALIPGQTTREQMQERYKAFAVDSGVPSLFWARFRKSNWVLVGGAGGVCWRGGRALVERLQSAGYLRCKWQSEDV